MPHYSLPAAPRRDLLKFQLTCVGGGPAPSRAPRPAPGQTPPRRGRPNISVIKKVRDFVIRERMRTAADSRPAPIA
ncbi:hypothetical protein EVAR_60973_1 [Eumeta japonica]|uniref:Uncharacterized protein n=1 Tax=Eumeta variegata TaxID=151549 RepID=A0A4C1XSI3_EUMVA|nr:hypothetical protein EVAR_60973_1 [Eumeta japonica]